MSNEQLVVALARELYDRFVMGGWEPQDAYPQIRELLNTSDDLPENLYHTSAEEKARRDQYFEGKKRKARGEVIQEILGIWDETIKRRPELKQEYDIAHEWLTKTFLVEEITVESAGRSRREERE